MKYVSEGAGSATLREDQRRVTLQPAEPSELGGKVGPTLDATQIGKALCTAVKCFTVMGMHLADEGQATQAEREKHQDSDGFNPRGRTQDNCVWFASLRRPCLQ